MMKCLGTIAGGLLLLGALASCRTPDEVISQPGALTVESAAEEAEKNLTGLRFDEMRRMLGREHLDHKILLGLPELTGQAGKSAVQAKQLAPGARATAELAMAYNVQLLTPDDAAARETGEMRIRQNLRLETELAAEAWLSLRERLTILREAAKSAAFPESGRREQKATEIEFAESALLLRTLLGSETGGELTLRRGADPGVPLWGDLLVIALVRRPEFRDAPLPAEQLAAAARKLAAKLPPETDPGNRTAVLLSRSEFLLRFPRFFAERHLADRPMPPELRFLALALVLEAELALDLTAYEAAHRASREAADSPVKDYESALALERAKSEEKMALRRLRNTLGLTEGEVSAPPPGERTAGANEEELNRTIDIILEMMGKEK
ncbi:MAG: hypothetical protein AB7F32_00020 [Victivallaceae bacterium]